MIPTLTSRRLRLRPWTVDDADAAFAVYSHEEVARWLSPTMDAVRDRHEMLLILQHWVAENHRSADPTGRWAIEFTEETRVIGGAATAERIGTEWVGETDKYYDLQLQVYRLRPADLDRPLADQQYGADQHRPAAQ